MWGNSIFLVMTDVEKFLISPCLYGNLKFLHMTDFFTDIFVIYVTNMRYAAADDDYDYDDEEYLNDYFDDAC